MKEFESGRVGDRPESVQWNAGSLKKAGNRVDVRARTSMVRRGDLLGNGYLQVKSERGGAGRCRGSFRFGGGVMWPKGGVQLRVRQGYVVSRRVL